MGIKGERLRAARGNRSLVEVYRATGVSRGLVSRLERGVRTSARIDTVAALADYYRVSVDHLLGRD